MPTHSTRIPSIRCANTQRSIKYLNSFEQIVTRWKSVFHYRPFDRTLWLDISIVLALLCLFYASSFFLRFSFDSVFCISVFCVKHMEVVKGANPHFTPGQVFWQFSWHIYFILLYLYIVFCVSVFCICVFQFTQEANPHFTPGQVSWLSRDPPSVN